MFVFVCLFFWKVEEGKKKGKKGRKESLAAALAAAAKSQLASTSPHPPSPSSSPEGVCECVSFTGFHLRESKHADLERRGEKGREKRDMAKRGMTGTIPLGCRRGR